MNGPIIDTVPVRQPDGRVVYCCQPQATRQSPRPRRVLVVIVIIVVLVVIR